MRPPPTMRRSAGTPAGRSTSSRGPAPTGSAGTALRVLPQRRASTRATTSRRRTSRRPTTAATSSAARSAARSRATGTFFFADYEGTRLREGITRVTNVPTPAERDGDFSQSLFPRPRQSVDRQPLPERPHPVVRSSTRSAPAIAALYPLPNRDDAVRELRLVADAATTTCDQFDVTGRSRCSRRQPASTARYSFAIAGCSSHSPAPAFSALPGFGNDVDRRGQNLVARYTLTPRRHASCNDVRLGYNRVAIGVFAENPQIDQRSRSGCRRLRRTRATPA